MLRDVVSDELVSASLFPFAGKVLGIVTDLAFEG